ncbi:MAG: McrC family protein [Bacteroidales bacterium]|nr:McrC family protein [Bacteroidales bacterium]
MKNFQFNMIDLFLNKVFTEHHKYPHGEQIPNEKVGDINSSVYFKNNKEKRCVELKSNNTLHTSYYIGIDWITDNKIIVVEPKLNKEGVRLNYINMLFHALNHPEVYKHTNDLYDIRFESKPVEIEKHQDLLTPLLAIHFIKIIKEIVKKGLKKSYYRKTDNLFGKVKGKINIAETIKQNHFKSKNLNTVCTYDEFGINNIENRLLKKALTFVQKYLSGQNMSGINNNYNELFGYINPAFVQVSEDVSFNEIKQIKSNAIYSEYKEAVKLALWILKRFGYSVNNINNKEKAKIPPFWIDMSKLFELYTLGLLKDKFGNHVNYHYTYLGNELDFLLNSNEYKMVIDAKYKPAYDSHFKNIDMRQVSGYARLKSVYNKLEKDHNEIIDCLIIYPNQESGIENFNEINLNDESNEIKEFVQMFKIGIKLPVIKE